MLSAAVGPGRLCPPRDNHILVPSYLSYAASCDVASIICQALGRGVTRSKRKATQWMRKAAENGHAGACLQLAQHMYLDLPYAREVGHVGEAAGVATSAEIMDGHDVSPSVLTGVVHWLRNGGHNLIDRLDVLRGEAREGGPYCRNEGCEVVGHVKDFKVCPQCKTVRYCSNACQTRDWTTGGHKTTCGLPSGN
jgi:TPR repeat protein